MQRAPPSGRPSKPRYAVPARTTHPETPGGGRSGTVSASRSKESPALGALECGGCQISEARCRGGHASSSGLSPPIAMRRVSNENVSQLDTTTVQNRNWQRKDRWLACDRSGTFFGRTGPSIRGRLQALDNPRVVLARSVFPRNAPTVGGGTDSPLIVGPRPCRRSMMGWSRRFWQSVPGHGRNTAPNAATACEWRGTGCPVAFCAFSCIFSGQHLTGATCAQRPRGNPHRARGGRLPEGQSRNGLPDGRGRTDAGLQDRRIVALQERRDRRVGGLESAGAERRRPLGKLQQHRWERSSDPPTSSGGHIGRFMRPVQGET